MWHKYKYPLYLLLVVLVCYWPLTFFQNTLLCDDIDVALPTKYFAGECYRNGTLPLWNPYQIWGFPAHADLQYTNWNPEAIIVGLTGGYNYNTLHVLFLGYLFLAGLGMFLLSKFLGKDERMAFFIGCIYMLSGPVTAHVQSLVTILGIVWMPFVLLYFLKLLEEPCLKHMALLCIYAYLLMSLGYQAFAFMLLPLLAVLFVAKLIAYYKAKDHARIKALLWYGVSAMGMMVVLLAPAIVTQLQSKPFVSRLNGMPLEEVMSNPFSPYALVSLINPLLTIGHDALFGADLTMRNFYFGLVPLLLLIASFFKPRKTTFDIILLSFAAIYLLGSFGDALPVRRLMYHVLPFFNLFRFPSLLRIVVFICLLCYLSLNLRQTIDRLFSHRKAKTFLLLGMIGLTLAVAVFAGLQVSSFSFFTGSHVSFNKRVISCSAFETAFYLSVIQLAGLLVLWPLSRKAGTVSRFFNTLLLVCLAEAFATIGIYGQHTAFSPPGPHDYQDNFSRLQRGFPEPSPDPVIDNHDKFNYIRNFWRNTGCYQKQLSLGDEWTSYYFTNFDFITNHLPGLRDTLNTYPFIYFSKPGREHPVILPVDTSAAFIRRSFHIMDAEAKVAYTAYDPNHIALTCSSPADVILNLQQSYFTGWTVKVDDAVVKPLWNMGLLMSVPVPHGVHQVEFMFENRAFVWCLVASYLTLVVLIVVVILFANIGRPGAVTWLLLLLGSVIVMAGRFWLNQKRHTGYDVAASAIAWQENGHMQQRQLNLQHKSDARTFMQMAHHQKLLSYAWRNTYPAPEIFYVLGHQPGERHTSIDGRISLEGGRSYRLLLSDRFDREEPYTDTGSYNGTRCMLLKRSHAYSLAKTIHAADIKKGIAGSLWMKCMKQAVPLMVCVIRHSDGREEPLYFPLNKYLVADGTWQQIPFAVDTGPLLQPGDEARVFIMNDTDQAVYIDDLVYETPN